jgi:hypothetical protein
MSLPERERLRNGVKVKDHSLMHSTPLVVAFYFLTVIILRKKQESIQSVSNVRESKT